MWKYGILLVLAVLFAAMQSCTLNNDILKPSCEVFEVELVEKVWHPAGEAQNLTFRSNGVLKIGESEEDVRWEIANCSTLTITNNTAGKLDTWTINDLNLDRLVINSGDNVIRYGNK